MSHALSAPDIIRLVGSQSFSRGERYARNGYVFDAQWLEPGTLLNAGVMGTAREPYDVTVTFTLDAAGNSVKADGDCTCPVGANCKHVAALLIATAGGSKPAQVVSAIRSAAMRQSPTLAPMTAERFASLFGSVLPPAWKSALTPLAKKHVSTPATGTGLALQFELSQPTPSRPGVASAPARLGVRPMLVGKSGKWIKGSLTWGNLSYNNTGTNPAQRKILLSLLTVSGNGQTGFYYGNQSLYLDTFPTEAVWEVLREAAAAGVPLITTNRQQDPITLSAATATVDLDIRRSASGLVLAPTLSLADDRLDGYRFAFTGNRAHGIFAWKELPRTQAGATGVSLILAPLAVSAKPVSAELRAVATAATEIAIPTSDVPTFLADFYPFLRENIPLTSHDGSFELPENPTPVLSVTITHRPGPAVDVFWEWQYGAETPASVAENDTDGPAEALPLASALYSLVLWPAPGEASYRDDQREAQIMHSVMGVLESLPMLAPDYRGQPRLRNRATLGGSTMMQFLDAVLPQLLATDDVLVNVSVDAPSYRAADEAPVIRLATTDRAGSQDWFNLDVTVSVDGEEIPFDQLFLALATDQELMILESGTYFNLDRPELHQLRALIEEARGLQEVHSDSLRISRFQADLWHELQLLGVVEAQAASWRSTIEGLTDTDAIALRPLPTEVQATLRPYQQSGFDWLSFLYDHRLGGILADDMGLGKTLQAIALIAHARAIHVEKQAADGTPPTPFLVVAPTSVVSNWVTECARFAPDLATAAITQTTGKRASSLASVMLGADVVITSYTLFRLDFDEYNSHEWAGLLLDEAQFVKNHQSKAHQSARRLNTSYKLAITGTPMENNLMELWSLLSITAPGLFPSPTKFTEYYGKPIEKDGNADRLTQLRRRIRPFMLRRTKAQVASDLPEKQEQVLELTLHPKHRKVYDMHLARERQKVLGLIEDMNANRFEIFRSLTMLRQLSLDASLYDKKYDSVPSTKLDALLELLEDTVAEGHRTLIFSQFTQYLGKARDRLDAAGISYSYLDGKTRNRAKAISDFKEGSSSVFLISLKAGGFGLNLTEADYVILLDPWWNPATEAQAVDRVHRIGQTKNVMVYRLVSKDTIEEKVMALKATKARLFESVMTDGAPAGTALTAADIRELLA